VESQYIMTLILDFTDEIEYASDFFEWQYTRLNGNYTYAFLVIFDQTFIIEGGIYHYL
jgi:hypothetical protein